MNNLKENSFLSRQEIEDVGFHYCAGDVQISRFARFYGAHNMSIGAGTRIDDFVIISAGEISVIGKRVHIGSHVFMSGQFGFELQDLSGISAGAKVFGTSDEFAAGGLIGTLVPDTSAMCYK